MKLARTTSFIDNLKLLVQRHIPTSRLNVQLLFSLGK